MSKEKDTKVFDTEYCDWIIRVCINAFTLIQKGAPASGVSFKREDYDLICKTLGPLKAVAHSDKEVFIHEKEIKKLKVKAEQWLKQNTN